MKEYIRSSIEVSEIAVAAAKFICEDLIAFGDRQLTKAEQWVAEMQEKQRNENL